MLAFAQPQPSLAATGTSFKSHAAPRSFCVKSTSFSCSFVRSPVHLLNKHTQQRQQHAPHQHSRRLQISMQDATPAPNSDKPSDSLLDKVSLFFYIGCWYAANILFNIVNKKLLKAFPLSLTVTLFQFAMGGAAVALLWLLRLHKYQSFGEKEIKQIFPLALSHVLGNLFTNLSLKAMAVSFTHTIKASEPFFSVVISKIFIPGTTYTPFVYASLVPIVAGVTLASVSEVSFNWLGFLTAMASNCAFQSRNVLSKKFMSDVKLDKVNLFGVISILSTLIMLPFTLIFEATKWGAATSAAASAGYTGLALLFTLCLGGLYHYLYNQFSYVVLNKVNPVTHAVGNTMKRVVVIVSSILIFKNPVTTMNKVGTAIAIAGVAIYSQVKSIKPKKKTA